jgi:CIC family chloride channel protein
MGLVSLRRIRLADEHREIIRLLALCVLVGLVAGFGAVLFYYLLKASDFFFMDYLAGYRLSFGGHEQPIFSTGRATSPPLYRWMLLVLPAVGGLVSGIIVFTLAPEAEGHGTISKAVRSGRGYR